MIKVNFRPHWITDADLGLVALNHDVNIDLMAEEKLSLSLKRGTDRVFVGDFSPRVIKVMVNNQQVAYVVADQSVIFRNLTADSVVEIYISPILMFQITNGVLPNGLNLNPYTGIISGVVNSNNTAKSIFHFTISVTSVTGASASRRFTMTIASDFKPAWITPAGLVATVREGDIVQTRLLAQEQNTYDVGPNEDYVIAVGYAQNVVTVFEEHSAIAFTVQGSEVHFGPSSVARTLTLVAKPSDLRFSVISGKLPTGLTLDVGTGEIYGTVGNLTVNDGNTYEFTVRVQNTLYVADRTFTIIAGNMLQLPEFITTSLPKQRLIPDLRGYYYDFGVVEHGQAFTFSLDILDVDQTNPRIAEKFFINLPDNGVYFTGLPVGISLVGNSIRGFVDPLGPAGIYVFAINLDVGNRTVALNCILQTILTIEPVGELLRRVDWTTTSGSLGTFYEGDVSTIQVAAQAVQTSGIKYGLSPSSGPLPAGLRIDPNTGFIAGQFGHVAKDTTSTFILRASAGHDFVGRVFSITVLNRFNSDEVYRFFLNTSVIDDAKIFPFYSDLISPNYIYRQGDERFGLVERGSIYLVSGINASLDAELNLADDPYRGRTRLVLGDHHVAVARNLSGKIVYEVLYRTLHDPLEGAGGFMDLDFPVESQVIWPQSEDPYVYIYPRSMTNMRLDIINRLGFAADEPLTYLGGLSGVENLPRWMRSEQTLNDPSTRTGFIPALVIAYLKPGAGKYVLRSIKKNLGTVTPNGHPLEFERYVEQYDRFFSGTIFDNDITTFDATLTFDDYIKGTVFSYGEKTMFDNGRVSFDGKTIFDRKNPTYN
jgi:hypothetical protein